jgi:hypothetical protein
VANAHISDQVAHVPSSENIPDQAVVFAQMQVPLIVFRNDTGCVLPTMLQDG